MAGPCLRSDCLPVPAGLVGRGNLRSSDLPDFVARTRLDASADQYNYISPSHSQGRGGRTKPLDLLSQHGFQQVGTPGSLLCSLVLDLGDVGPAIQDARDQEASFTGRIPRPRNNWSGLAPSLARRSASAGARVGPILGGPVPISAGRRARSSPLRVLGRAAPRIPTRNRGSLPSES